MFDMTEQDWLIKAENPEENEMCRVEGKEKPEVCVCFLCVFLFCGLWQIQQALDQFCVHMKVAYVYFGTHINRLQ